MTIYNLLSQRKYKRMTIYIQTLFNKSSFTKKNESLVKNISVFNNNVLRSDNIEIINFTCLLLIF